MERRICLCLVIICAIFTQGISTSSSENIEKKSHLHRQKRVTNRTIDGGYPVWIEYAPFMVNIQKNGRNKCGGSILSAEVILSSASCFIDSSANYSVLSGSLQISRRIRHTIINKLIFPYYNPTRLEDDLALLFIHPPIDFERSHNRIIRLFNGNNLRTNTLATLSGWSSNPNIRLRLVVPNELRSIVVPVITLNACREFYRGIREITVKEICTLDRNGRKFGTSGDVGGPLVTAGSLVDTGDQIGVYSWSGKKFRRENPDVYMNLLHPLYKSWILANARIHHS